MAAVEGDVPCLDAVPLEPTDHTAVAMDRTVSMDAVVAIAEQKDCHFAVVAAAIVAVHERLLLGAAFLPPASAPRPCDVFHLPLVVFASFAVVVAIALAADAVALPSDDAVPPLVAPQLGVGALLPPVAIARLPCASVLLLVFVVPRLLVVAAV